MKKCCCCSLRTGSLVIGILNIVGTLLGIIFWFAVLFVMMPFLTENLITVRNDVSSRKTMLEDHEKTNTLTEEQSHALFQLSNAETQLNDAVQKLETYDEINKHYITPVCVITCILHLSFSSALIHGIRKKSSGLIRSWMIYYAIMTVLSIFFSVIYYLFMLGASVTGGQIFSLIFGYGFTLAIAVFMLKVVNDYLKEMNQQPFVKQRV